MFFHQILMNSFDFISIKDYCHSLSFEKALTKPKRNCFWKYYLFIVTLHFFQCATNANHHNCNLNSKKLWNVFFVFFFLEMSLSYSICFFLWLPPIPDISFWRIVLLKYFLSECLYLRLLIPNILKLLGKTFHRRS